MYREANKLRKNKKITITGFKISLHSIFKQSGFYVGQWQSVILNFFWNIFELGITSNANIKRVFDCLLSIFVNIRENHHHHFLFVDLSVGAAHLCDSMKLFIALLPFLGLVYCSAAPTDIEKRSAMGLYIMIVYCFCSLYFVFKMIIFFIWWFFFPIIQGRVHHLLWSLKTRDGWTYNQLYSFIIYFIWNGSPI